MLIDLSEEECALIEKSLFSRLNYMRKDANRVRWKWAKFRAAMIEADCEKLIKFLNDFGRRVRRARRGDQ